MEALPTDFDSGAAVLTQDTTTMTVPLTISGGRAQTTVEHLTGGTWTVTLRFYNASGSLTYEGSANASVTSGSSTSVTITVSPAGGNLTVGADLPLSTLINRLENSTSEYGPSFTVTGSPQVLSAVFNKGLKLDEANYLSASLSSAVLDPNHGTIEFWYIPSWNQSEKTGQYRSLMDSSDMSRRIYFAFDDLDYFAVGAFGAGVSLAKGTYPVSMVAGTAAHMAIVWNATGIDGTAQTFRVYVNGALIGSSSGALNTTQGNQTLYLGRHILGVTGAKGIFDNFKIHSYSKVDFSDRFSP